MQTSRLATGFAALALALLTTGVFFVLRNAGPESALRRFHQAALNGDARELATALTPESGERSVRALAGRVVEFGQAGGRFRLESLDRRGRVAIADVSYLFPNRGLAVSTLWVLENRKGRWLIDADETARIIPRVLGTPIGPSAPSEGR